MLGDAADLRIQLEYARNNAGQDWNACAVVYNPALESGIKSWADAVDVAMELASVEGVILTEPLKAVSDVEAMQAKGEAIMGKYMRPLWFGGRAPAFDPETQSWADYATAIKPLTADVAADTCLVTPSIWGYELGTLAETAALEQGFYSGVDFVASVHAASVEEAARRPQVQALQRHGMLRVFVLLHGCTTPGKVRRVCTV